MGFTSTIRQRMAFNAAVETDPCPAAAKSAAVGGPSCRAGAAATATISTNTSVRSRSGGCDGGGGGSSMRRSASSAAMRHATAADTEMQV